MRRARVGVRDGGRPNASFLFIGNSGVGKTECAKALADAVFYKDSSFIRFDMSEFSVDSMVEYIKVSVRSLGSSDSTKGYTFSLSSITGHSMTHTAGELSGLISDERLRIRDLYNDTHAPEISEKNTWMIMLGAGLTVVVIGIGVFMCFRREEEHSDTTDTENK